MIMRISGRSLLEPGSSSDTGIRRYLGMKYKGDYREIMKTLNLALILLLLLVLAGCAASSSNYTYQANQEVPEGKGLFSGEDGEFTLYKK